MAQNPQVHCNRCDSLLIEISSVVQSSFFSPNIIIKYRCTDEICQKDADDKMEQMVLRRELQQKAKELRTSQKKH